MWELSIDVGAQVATASSGSGCQRSMITLQIIYLGIDYLSWTVQSTNKTRFGDAAFETSREISSSQVSVQRTVADLG